MNSFSSQPKILFAGTPDIAATIPKALLTQYPVAAVLTAPDKPKGRGQHKQPSPVKTLALEHQLPILQPVSLRQPEMPEALKTFSPDLMIVVAYGLLIPENILSLPRLGCVNVHLSLLPRWRGASPITQAILAGDPETGVTLMQMDKGLDTGSILSTASYPLKGTETTESLSTALAQLAADTLSAELPQILAGVLTPIPQNNSLSCYAAKLGKSDGQIHWENSAVDIERAIRAYTPWPTSYSFLQGKRIKLLKAQSDPQVTTAIATPGTLTAIQKTHLSVQTGKGVLKLFEVQLEGGKPQPIHALLNNPHHPFQVGNCFCDPSS